MLAQRAAEWCLRTPTKSWDADHKVSRIPRVKSSLKAQNSDNRLEMPSRNGRILRCFYCNKRSHLRYDGRMTKWTCGNCEADNYLDKNGEITDPPVATSSETQSHLKWGRAVGYSDSQDSVFCQRCQKNQHQLRACLAQYLPEDPEDPVYQERLAELDQYTQRLEEMYPQVCEDCADRVQERIKQAVYKAKVDAYGKLLEKTRKLGGPGRRQQRTWSERLESWGRVLWRTAVAAELLCAAQFSVEACRPWVDSRWPVYNEEAASFHQFNMRLIYNVYDGLNYMVSRMTPAWIPDPQEGVVLLILSSIWWNPRFRYTLKGGLHQVHGKGMWYGRQMIVLAVIAVTFSTRVQELLESTDIIIASISQALLLLVTSIVSIQSLGKITATRRRIFATVDKITLLPKRRDKTSTRKASNGLFDLLDEIETEPTRSKGAIADSPPSSPASSSNSQDSDAESPMSKSSSRRGTGSITSQRLGSQPLKTTITHTQQQIVSQDPDMMDLDEMEWTPSQPSDSRHRAFSTETSPIAASRSFGATPAAPPKSAFWYKSLPAAPVAPAHRARNPLSQARFVPKAPEAQQNFFSKLTAPKTDVKTTGGRAKSSASDFVMAPPKFFAEPAEDDTGLADAFDKAFNLAKSSGTGAQTRSRGLRQRQGENAAEEDGGASWFKWK